MDRIIKELFGSLRSSDNAVRMNALQKVLALTESRVDWIYEVWEDLFQKLNHKNSFQRSIAIMVLCNLAKSDGENRLNSSLNLLLEHTRDEKFITSRQCIQNIWKIALTNDQARETILDHFEQRFRECATEKHYNLIRQDILQSMVSIWRQDKDDTILSRARELLAEEKDMKYRKKYEYIFSSI